MGVEETVVVDLGGSTGVAMIALTIKFPRLTAVVQDLRNPIAGHLMPPPEARGRIRFMAHDFFNEQPVKDADVYFFRLVFHDWSDKDCFRILRATHPGVEAWGQDSFERMVSTGNTFNPLN